MIGEARHILLVEDDEFDRELAFRALQKHAIHVPVEIARDGEEAMEAVHRYSSSSTPAPGSLPVLILLDLNLPKLDGCSILAELKAGEMTKCVPVVVLTSSCRTQDISRSYLAGANSYIQKPVSFQKFEATLKEIADYWLGLNVRCQNTKDAVS
jgi:two-component system response regulator